MRAQQSCALLMVAAARTGAGMNRATSAPSNTATSVIDAILETSCTMGIYFFTTPHVSISLPAYGFEIFSEVCTQSFFSIGQCITW